MVFGVGRPEKRSWWTRVGLGWSWRKRFNTRLLLTTQAPDFPRPFVKHFLEFMIFKVCDLLQLQELVQQSLEGCGQSTVAWPGIQRGWRGKCWGSGVLADQQCYACATECCCFLLHIQLSHEIHRTQNQFGQLTLKILFLWDHSQNQSLFVIYYWIIHYPKSWSLKISIYQLIVLVGQGSRSCLLEVLPQGLSQGYNQGLAGTALICRVNQGSTHVQGHSVAIGQPQFLVNQAFPQVAVFSRDSDPRMDEGDQVFK